MCIALQFDDDGTEVWYRAQFQQNLENGRAQAGFVNFNVITALRLEPVGKSFEIHFGQNYFFEDDNFEHTFL